MDCALSTAPNHPNLSVTRALGASAKLRKTYLISKSSIDRKIAVYNNTLTCAERAVKERVFYVRKDDKFVSPPRPGPNHFLETLAEVTEHFKRTYTFCTPMEAEAFALSYQAPKQKVYLRAVRSLEQTPFQAKDAYIQAFTKCEKYVFNPKKIPVPRIIQPRSPRYNVCVGRYLKPIEHKIYESIDQLFGSKTIMKGLNQITRAKIIQEHFNSFADPCALGLDASRFDQHVSVDALKWEHKIYNMFYRSRKLRRLLKHQLKNKCFINLPDGHIRYTTNGCRMSGDINTSLGNCLIMACMVYAYAKYRRVQIKLVNDGDDCVVFLNRKDLDHFSTGLDDWFLAMGFNMTVEDPVYELEKIQFCSSNPVYLGPHYVMVRNPSQILSKDSVSLRDLYTPQLAERWMAAVGIGGLTMCGGIPVVQDFYKSFVVASRNARPLEDQDFVRRNMLAEGMDLIYKVPSAETRYSFYLAFGIDPDCQIAIEGVYRDLNLSSKYSRVLEYLELPL